MNIVSHKMGILSIDREGYIYYYSKKRRRKMAEIGYEKKLAPGEVLFREGDPGDEMYLIKKGEIKITKRIGDQEKVLAVLKEGDFFGEMAIIDGSPRSASAIAATETELVIVDREAFLKQIRENPFIEYVLETLIKRLRETDELLKYMFIKNEERRIATYLLNTSRSGEKIDVNKIGNILGIEDSKVKEVISKLVRNNLLSLEGNVVKVKDEKLLQEYIEYISLKEKFEK
ncbi:hypothetical protein DRQ18_05845 [bacterium]|nr:MAG: hypothetical protein DRQ18_05845 [bacterium]